MILANTYGGLWAQGSGNFPGSNNYGQAVEACSAVCDSDLSCLSFNVITVYESDFASCVPTWECRFSNSVYNPSNYTLDNGTPSYVWSIQADAPSCALTSDSQISPETWTSMGMDQYLNNVARIAGIYDNTDKFVEDLLSALGYVGSVCLSDQNTAACPSGPLTIGNCANFVEYQLSAWEIYMEHNSQMYDNIVTLVGDTGLPIYNELWWTQVPAHTQWNPTASIEAVLGLGIGLIPEFGSVANSIRTPIQSLMTWTGNTGPVPVVPNEETTWAAFMSSISLAVLNATTTIDNLSQSVTQSNEFLSLVTQGGTWFLEDTSVANILPDLGNMWANLGPYFAAKIAMQAMQSQSVFFMSVPLTLLDANTACTQTIADNFASHFSGTSAGVAWCVPNTEQIIIPLLGWNLEVYSNFPSVAPLSNSTNADILASSSSCYPGFGVNTNDIALYDSNPEVPSNPQTPDIYFDMTSPCAWSVPICDYTAWSTQMLSQQKTAVTSPYSPSSGEMLINTASYCAYNFGFVSEALFRGSVVEEVNEGHGTETKTVDSSTNWTPKPTMTIVPL